MIKVNSIVKMNMPFIRKLSEGTVKALELTAEELHTTVQQAQVVTRMDGALQGESFFLDATHSPQGRARLIHATPYARRLYFHPEYKFHREPWEEEWTDREGKKHHASHDGNPNAKGLWFEDWEEGGKQGEFCRKAFEKIYRRLAGL